MSFCELFIRQVSDYGKIEEDNSILIHTQRTTCGGELVLSFHMLVPEIQFRPSDLDTSVFTQ